MRPKISHTNNLKSCNEGEANADQLPAMCTSPLSGDSEGRKKQAQIARGSSGNESPSLIQNQYIPQGTCRVLICNMQKHICNEKVHEHCWKKRSPSEAYLSKRKQNFLCGNLALFPTYPYSPL